MPALPLSMMSDDRLDYGMPVARLVNMYVEKIPEGETADARFPRPGLVNLQNIGTGPIRGVFQTDNVIDGDFLVASGEFMWRYSGTGAPTNIGAISGTNPVRFAAGYGGVIGFVTDGKYYTYDGITYNHVTTYDDGTTALPLFSDIAYLGDSFLLSVVDSDQFFFTAIDGFNSINALNFESADSLPDNIIGMALLGDEILILSQQHAEWWTLSGNANAPYSRSQGRNFTRGCAGQNTISVGDNALFYVGDDRVVYRSGLVPQRVSTHGIEERLRASVLDPANDWTAWSFTFSGHAFYILNLPDQGSFAYDVSTGLWAEWQSYGQKAFVGGFGVMRYGSTFIGSAIGPAFYTLSATANTDDGQTITRVVSAFLAQPARALTRLNNISLSIIGGVGSPTGDVSSVQPRVQMRLSDDGGRTWGSWLVAEAGKIGEYFQRPVWTRLGFIGSFGIAVEWRSTDPVRFVAQRATFNEPYPF